jgi:hypothetical protein
VLRVGGGFLFTVVQGSNYDREPEPALTAGSDASLGDAALNVSRRTTA